MALKAGMVSQDSAKEGGRNMLREEWKKPSGKKMGLLNAGNIPHLLILKLKGSKRGSQQ